MARLKPLFFSSEHPAINSTKTGKYIRRKTDVSEVRLKVKTTVYKSLANLLNSMQ
jgi:hypothetical protein